MVWYRVCGRVRQSSDDGSTLGYFVRLCREKTHHHKRVNFHHVILNCIGYVIDSIDGSSIANLNRPDERECRYYSHDGCGNRTGT